MRKLCLCAILTVLAGCSERELPVPIKADSVPVLEKHIIPSFVNPGKSFMVTIQVKNAAPADVDSVSLSIRKAGETGSVHFALFDDGAAMHENDEDVVAHDGIFSQKISWQASIQQREEFIFRFEATDKQNQQSEPLEVTVVSIANSPPRIAAISMPDSLPSGFDGLQYIKVTATDSNEVDDIVQVNYRGSRNDTTFFQGTLKDDGLGGDEMAGDGVFSVSLDRSFAITKKGSYEMVFEAQDKSGSKSQPASRALLIGNGAPIGSNISAPDSVKRPTTGTTSRLITIRVDDPQTLKDVKSARLEWKKPDGSFPSTGPYFTIYDNGLPFDVSKWDLGYRGDAVAGDGVYSITGVFDSDDLLGPYTLTFQIEDWVGNKSVPLVHIIRLY